MKPRVDVIVPCYNYGDVLEACVQSILTQQDVDVRVMIMDDASSDSTQAVGMRLAAADARVEYRRHTVNRGHIATYNEALAMLTGDFVLLLSADDMLTPGALRRATRAMIAHPEVGIAYGPDIPFRHAPPTDAAPSTAVCTHRIMSYVEFLERSCRLGHTPIQAPTIRGAHVAAPEDRRLPAEPAAHRGHRDLAADGRARLGVRAQRAAGVPAPAREEHEPRLLAGAAARGAEEGLRHPFRRVRRCASGNCAAAGGGRAHHCRDMRSGRAPARSTTASRPSAAISSRSPPRFTRRSSLRRVAPAAPEAAARRTRLARRVAADVARQGALYPTARSSPRRGRDSERSDGGTIQRRAAQTARRRRAEQRRPADWRRQRRARSRRARVATGRRVPAVRAARRRVPAGSGASRDCDPPRDEPHLLEARASALRPRRLPLDRAADSVAHRRRPSELSRIRALDGLRCVAMRHPGRGAGRAVHPGQSRQSLGCRVRRELRRARGVTSALRAPRSRGRRPAICSAPIGCARR